MNFKRFTLQFTSPAAGRLDSFKIYGAILSAAYEISKEDGDLLYTSIKRGELRISTLLPLLKHKGHSVQYLPAPKFLRVLTARALRELQRENKKEEKKKDKGIKKRVKEMKKISYLSERELKALADSLKSGIDKALEWVINLIKSAENKENDDTTHKRAERVSDATLFLKSAFETLDIPRNAHKRISVSPNLYYDRVMAPKEVELNLMERVILHYSILVECDQKDALSILCSALKLLEDRGIGSEISVGCGRFRIVDVDSWKLPVQREEHDYVMLLSNAILKDMENLHTCKGNFYTYSTCYGYNRAGERIPVTHYLEPGSVIRHGYEYTVREVEYSAINYTLVGIPLTIPFPTLE